MAKFKTFSTRIGGQTLAILDAKSTAAQSYWISRDTEGLLEVHLGALVDGPVPSKVLDKPKPCSRCKAPSWAATPKGRARHDGCEGWLDTMPDEAFAQVVFETAVEAGVQIDDPVSIPFLLLNQQLGAQTPSKAFLALPASRVSPRVVAGLRRAAEREPGPFQLAIRLFNNGQRVELDLPHLVDTGIVPRLQATFGRDSAYMRVQ